MKAAALSMTPHKKEHIEKTVSEERSRLLNFIRKFVSRNEDAEDILQDVFYQFVSGYDRIRSLDQISSWLFQVARNKITDNHRKKVPESFSDFNEESNEEGQPLMLEDILPDIGSLPDQKLLTEIIWEKVEETLVLMPETQRQVFIWHEFEQKSFKEIAKLTGETINTLISRKRYAILALRVELTELYKELIND